MMGLEDNNIGVQLTKVGWVSNDWKVVKLSEISKTITSGSTPLRENQEYFKGGRHFWVKTTDLNNGYIWSSEEKVTDLAIKEARLKKLPIGTILIAMYGGFNQIGRTGMLKIESSINQALTGLILNQGLCTSEYVLQWLNYGRGFWRRYAASSRKDPNITKSDVCDFLIAQPPLIEQQKIAEILSTWDEAITNTEKLIKQLKKRKKGLMQSLLTGKKRLKGFSGEWKEAKLGDYFTERKDTGCLDLPLLSVGKEGVYPYDIEKKDNSNHDKSKYKRILPNDIGYNTMRMWQGRSALSQLEGIVSPAYTIVTPKEQSNATFFSYLFKLDEVIHKFYRNSQGMVSDTWMCKFKDFSLVRFQAPPKREEQDKIALILLEADSEIDNQIVKKKSLELQKKGLMQQLLTGQKRVKL